MATERGIEADEGLGEAVERNLGADRTGHPGDFHVPVHQDGEGQQPETGGGPDESERKDKREPPHREPEEAIPGPSSLGSTASRMHWQTSPWSQQEGRSQDEREGDGGEGEQEAEVDFGRFTDGAFGGGATYDEIEDGTGQVSQRPLVPASPDNSEFAQGPPPELNWPSAANISQAGAPLTPTSVCHTSPTSATFPPSSPPTPTSSSLSLAGAPYTGKVHFCHCGKAYTLKSMRDRHVKMQHLNLRPFGCLVCAKTFKMKHHLTKHLKTHGGLRPYECRLCGKKVIWRDSFLRHQARCERLAASYSGAPVVEGGGDAAVADMDSSYGGYGFDEGEGFLSEVGQVKVEEADFQVEVMSGILGRVAKGGETLDQSRALVNDGFKEEVRDRFS